MSNFVDSLRESGTAAIRFVGSFATMTDPVHDALFRTAKRLDELSIPYALCGGMALAMHGYDRATVDVNLLVTADGLRRAHDNLEGRGYIAPFAGSKQLKETDNGGQIEFLVTGGFPGDGLPKPVSFPDPTTTGVSLERDGIKVLSLEYAERLNPYVRGKCRELWQAMHAPRPEIG